MSESLSTWLALREAADASARSVALTTAVAERLRNANPVRVLDLGTGTGSNLRYLAPHLGLRQEWLLVDRDPDVLANMAPRMSEWASVHGYRMEVAAGGFVVSGSDLECRVTARRLELGRLDDPELFANRDLVTASALLDLVSSTWLVSLASRCREHRLTALFALTYDGRSTCSPGEREDDDVRELLNQHQRHMDKGFGTAAGPDAPAAAADAFGAAGYTVRMARSDWQLPPVLTAMQRELVEGWAEAALELVPEDAASIRDWLARRQAHIDAGRSTITVGHQDVAAWL